MAAPHQSVPDMLAAMEKAIERLEAGRREDHVKMETQHGRIEVLRAKIETQQEFFEELQADSRAQKTTNEAQAETNLSQSRMIEELMKSHRRAQTLTRHQMLEQYRAPMLEAVRRGEATEAVPILIKRVRGDPNTTEFDRWVLNEYARVSENIHGEHRKHEARDVADTGEGMYSELYRRLYASD